jgi:acetyl esterase/lipase
MWATRDAKWPLKRLVAVCLLRHRSPLVKRASTLATAPTTGESILAACRKRNIVVSSSTLHCGGQFPDATLHEIKLDEAQQGDTTLLYFHGGGYRNGIIGEGHVPVVLDCAAAARASKLIFLEYTLAPESTYPGQLVQAARALDVLLNERHLRPSQIILGGDSAGGNLVLALLAHLHDPAPGVPRISGFGKEAGEAFKGVFLFSPWVTTSLAAASFRENASRDYLNETAARMFLGFWKPREEVWADILRAKEDFWGTLPVEKMVVTVGGFEVFRDDVVLMAKKCVAGMGERLTFESVPGEIHVQAVVDRALGLPPTPSLVVHLKWLQGL